MKICDAHNDFITAIKNPNKRKKYYISLLKNHKIKYISCIIWTTKIKNPILFYSKIKNNIVLSVKSKKKVKCFFSFEDLGFINNKNKDFAIGKIIKFNLFSTGLVWNYNNKLGGGALEKGNLTKLGREVVRKLESKNIIIDTAHMNRKTFYSFCRITKKPIYNSHSNINFLFKNNRNLTNSQIQKIVDSNGFLGISFVNNFISKKIITTQDIAKQFVYLTKKFSEDNFGIGSDFFGTKFLPKDLRNYSQFKNLYKSLKKEGLNKDLINKILYKNYAKFIERILYKK